MEADAATTTTACPDVPASAPTPAPETKPVRKLPAQCTGCGAFSQTGYPDQPGFFGLGRKAVRQYLGVERQRERKARPEEDFYLNRLKSLSPEDLEKLGLDKEDIAAPVFPGIEIERPDKPLKRPLCDRCHKLVHYNSGESIYHPSIDSIRDTIAESPYKYNHVYHLIDAADFPMSLLPNIQILLDLMPLRTQNRRSKAGKFYHGQQTEMSFIITRSDLLAPTKEQLDRLVPYLREVLRDALGRAGDNVRLGNIRCVSAKRSWWTKELKEEIWRRGGAGWMVGKVNVGKSQLFEAVFPKGRMDWTPTSHQITIGLSGKEGGDYVERIEEDEFDEFALLPPAPPETQYPEMPLVSDLPGTTASPIRVPFGNGRGELIDLPGMERTGLEKYVKEEHRKGLVLRSRVVPEQQVLTPGRSLLLGGFIRLTPREPAPVVLAYAFTPTALNPHVTRTDKAIDVQRQISELNVDSIAVPGTGEKTKRAQSVQLKWDVTRERAGPITRKDGLGFKVERLPYRVLAADILIEGMGWVEVVAQVRAKDLFAPRPRQALPAPEFETWDEDEPELESETLEREPETKNSALERLEALTEDPQKKKKKTKKSAAAPAPITSDDPDEPSWPVIDVYTPEGKFIDVRRPMNGWLLNRRKPSPESKRARPRKSLKGNRQIMKAMRRRAEEAAQSSR